MRAGPLTAVLDGVDLRYVRLGDTELVRRIYVAVRDRNWNTIPGVASEVEIEQERRLVLGALRGPSLEPRHRLLAGRARSPGLPTGASRFAMDGRGERAMLYNRIGFCVLHPWREAAGRRFRGYTPDGPVDGELPLLVGPQRFVDGAYVALLPSVSRLEIELPAGGSAVFEFEGDLFETEDQRNWTDASFKTYCTPLALGFPHELAEGERKAQAVTVSGARARREPLPLESRSSAGRCRSAAPPGARVPRRSAWRSPPARPVPSDGEAAAAADARARPPARASVHIGRRRLAGRAGGAAARCARSLGAPLELALFVDGAAVPSALDALRSALAGVEVARVLVAMEGAQTTTVEETTPAGMVQRGPRRAGARRACRWPAAPTCTSASSTARGRRRSGWTGSSGR